MPDEITKVVVGVPGPPGGGVTAAELAGLMPKTGSTFTGVATFRPSANGTGFVILEDQAGTDILVYDSTNKILKLQSGTDLRFYSDAGTTEVSNIDGATGAIQSDSTVTADGGRVPGDEIFWGFVIDNAGVAITTGVKIDYPVPYNCKITQWELVADVSGSIVLDLWSDTYANFPPTVADTITGAEKPTLSAVQKNTDTSLAAGVGWPLTGGRWLRINVDSATTVTRVTLSLKVERT
jgi:hypothetical protein